MALTDNMYLGDGAYCGKEFGDIVLYTSDGLNRTNTVVLGPAEVKALLVWLESQNFIPNLTQDCHNCDGFGQIRESRKCAVCNGSGKK